MKLKSLILLSLLDNFNSYQSNYQPYEAIYKFLENYSKSSVRATTGSLLKEGDVEKIVKNGIVYFSLTLKGFRTVSEKFLKPYKGFKKRWDGKWRMIIFNIPENKRQERTRLRQILKQFQFGRISNSVYVSPFDNLTPALKFAKENLNDVYTSLFVFETVQDGAMDNAEIASIAFNLLHLAKEYRNWIKRVREMEEIIDTLVSYYDTILESDPALPGELLPMDWPFIKSWNIFLNLLQKKGKIPPKKTSVRPH